MFRLLKNEKTLLLTNEDVFTKISLIFSRIQKEILDDNDVQVSDVLDAFNKIKEATIAPGKETCNISSIIVDDISEKVANQYMHDLKSQNLIDAWVLFNKLYLFLESNNKSNKHGGLQLVKDANVLMVIPEHFYDTKLVDSQMAELLFPEQSHKLQVVLSDISSTGETSANEITHFELTTSTWTDIKCSMEEKTRKHMKRVENYHLQLFLGYFKLLTNSRDELSLAKVLCGAGGILNHDAFNALKKESLKTKMPMYQVRFLFL